MLALDVPERDIDGADGARDDVAAEGAEAVEALGAMLDRERVLADEVRSELLDDLGDRVRLAPRARLADAGDAAIGRDADRMVAADLVAASQLALDLLDPHGHLSSTRIASYRGPDGLRGGPLLVGGARCPTRRSTAHLAEEAGWNRSHRSDEPLSGLQAMWCTGAPAGNRAGQRGVIGIEPSTRGQPDATLS